MPSNASSSPLSVLAIVLAAIFAAVGVGIFVYVSVSFVIMRPHTAPRPHRHALRDALREIHATLLTQPLLPFFYFVGRRLGGRAAGTPIVFVHGYMQNRVDFWPMARRLAERGLGPLYGFNYPWYARIDDSAERLARFVEDVRRETGAPHVDLVCHSMGGLVALAYLTGGASRVRRCATVATPHAGVVWRGPIPGWCGSQLRAGSPFLTGLASATTPSTTLLSIFSTHDNVVHPHTTSSVSPRGGRDHEIDGGGHLGVLLDPRVTYELAEFLGGRGDVDADAAHAHPATPPVDG